MTKIIALGTNTTRNTFFKANAKTYTVDDSHLWKSLFALAQETCDEGKEFREFLKKTDATHVVLDLYSLGTTVFDNGKTYLSTYNKTAPNGYTTHYYFNDNAKVEAAIKSMVALLSERFGGGKILLLRTHVSNYRAFCGYVRFKNDFDEFNDRLRSIEDRFIAALKCSDVDVAYCYFSDAECELGESQVNLEPECYAHMRELLNQWLKQTGEDGRSYTCDFMHKMLHFAKFGNFCRKSYQTKLLMDTSIKIEAFCVDMGATFVRKYAEQIDLLRRQKLVPTEQMLKDFPEFCDAFFGFKLIEQSKYKELTASQVEVLKKYETLSLQKAVREMQYLLKSKNIDNHVVNSLNIAHYIPYLSPFSVHKLKDKCSADIAPQPTLIDVWGSCIAREIATFLPNEFELNTYLYRTSPLNIFSDPVPVKKDLFDDLTLFKGSQWRANNCKNEFERKGADIIRQTKAKWCLVDLYDIVENVKAIDGKRFIFDYDTTQMLFRAKIHEDYQVKECAYDDLSDAEMMSKIDKYVELLKSVYGSQIILIDVFFHHAYLDYKGKIAENKQPYDVLLGKNAFLKKWQDYIYQKLDCFRISLSDKFLADEFFVWGPSPVHYETLFFRLAANAVGDFVSGAYPSRVISDYDSEAKMTRLKRMMKGGNDIRVMLATLCSNWLDKYLISVNNNTIARTGIDSLVRMYDGGYADLVDLLKNFDFKDCTELQNELQKMML